MGNLLQIKSTMLNGLAVRNSHMARAAEFIDKLGTLLDPNRTQVMTIREVDEFLSVEGKLSDLEKCSVALILGEMAAIGLIDCWFRETLPDGTIGQERSDLFKFRRDTKVESIVPVYRFPSLEVTLNAL
jgi:hypothetical protein